jgi:MinD-like ATPase involved in chromosome partitioning or flagellar assembly
VAGRHPVLTALTGGYEATLVGALEHARGEVLVVRRCVDLTDLLAAAGAGRAVAVLVSADLRRLDRDALARLRAHGLAVVGVVDPGRPEQADRLRALGVEHAVAADCEPALVDLAVAEALARPSPRPWSAAPADPADALPAVPVVVDDDGPGGVGGGRGRLVAVWGPVGSPGRTTVATTLAAELAALRHDTLLVDADTYGASVAQVLGVLDEAPGLAAACRAATAGTLDPSVLARLSPVVAPHLRVLTGISRADRWPELSATGLEQVWAAARALGPWTVVDTGFALERDEELSYDTLAPRRNAATLAALEASDVVLAVGAGDPVGLQRLVRGLGDLAEVLPQVRARVVVTRVRSSAVGPDPQRRVADALRRYAAVERPVLVPDDRPAVDAALLAGRTLTEHAPASAARQALAALAAELAGVVPGGRGRRRARSSARTA